MTLYSEEMDVAYCVVMNFFFFFAKATQSPAT